MNKLETHTHEEMMERLFDDPGLEMIAAIGDLGLPPELGDRFMRYLSEVDEFGRVNGSPENMHKGIEPLINEAIEIGRPEIGIALLNLHRFVSGQYRGYKVKNEIEPSSDIDRAFPESLVLPEEGAVVVSGRFAARNLLEIMNKLEAMGRLKDLVVRVPRFMLAAQVRELDEPRRSQLQDGLKRLSPDQLQIRDVADESQIELPEKIAAAFMPRELAIDADAAVSGSEQLAAEVYRAKAEEIKNRMVPGATLFAYTA